MNKNTRKNPQKQLTMAHRGLTENELAISEPVWDLSPQHTCYGCVAWYSGGPPNSGSKAASDSSAYFWRPLLLLNCLMQL